MDPRNEGEPLEGMAENAVLADEIVNDSREVLLEYLSLIRTGRYATALTMYGGDAAALPREAWFGTDTLSAEQFLRAACTGGLLFCDLRVRKVVEARLISPDTVRITLELETEDGSRFEPTRCCGEPGPVDTLFHFNVLARNGTFSVLSLPVYRP